MKSIYWIEQAKAASGIESDYKIAQVLGMSRSGISHHRSGKAVTLDDDAAYKVEELCGLPHGRVVMDQHAERAKNPNISAMWRKLAASAAVLLVLSNSCIVSEVIKQPFANNLLFSRIFRRWRNCWRFLHLKPHMLYG